MGAGRQLLWVLLLFAIVAHWSDGARLQFGSLLPLYNISGDGADVIRYLVTHNYAGVDAAFKEANDAGELGADTVELIVGDLGDLNNVQPQALTNLLASMTGTRLGFMLSTFWGAPLMYQYAKANPAPLIGQASAFDTPTDSKFVFYRVPYEAELRQTLKFVTQRLRATRICYMYWSQPVGIEKTLNLVSGWFERNGYPKPYLLPVESVASLQSNPLQLTSLLFSGFNPQVIMFVGTPDILLPSMVIFHQFPFFDTNTVFVSTSDMTLPTFSYNGSSAYFQNLYLTQQLPDPSDSRREIVRRYQSALHKLLSKPYAPYGTTVSEEYSVFGLEGYMSGRFAVEVLKRTANHTAAGLLSTVYSQKFFQLDDITAGPYSDGCIGQMANDNLFSCSCNVGNKVLYVTRVNGTTGKVQYLEDDVAGGEVGVCRGVTQLHACWDTIDTLGKPLLALTADTSGSQPLSAAEAYFNAQLTNSVARLNLAFPGTTLGLVARPVSSSTMLKRANDDFLPLAFIGGQLASANFSANGIGTARFGAYSGRLELRDVVTTPFDPSTIAIDATLADYIHAAAYAIASLEASTVVRLVADNYEQLNLGVLSLNTFGIQPATSLLTASNAADIVTGGRQSDVLLVVSQDSAAVAATLTAIAARGDSTPAVYFAADEDLLHDGLGINTAGALVGLPPRVFCASVLAPWWDIRALTAPTLAAMYAKVMAPAAVPNPLAVRAFRTAYTFSYIAQQIQGVATPATFLSLWYSSASFSILDYSLGRFSNTTCRGSSESVSASRSCECAKGPRVFRVLNVTDWAASDGNRSADAAVLATYTMTGCGVEYTPLPSSKSSLVAPLAGGVGGGGAGLVLLLLVVLVLTRRKTRNNAAAPVDPDKPFAVVFTDIQASTALWAMIPEVMTGAVETHHTLIRSLIDEHEGYEVKTIGDSFMVAFRSPVNAVRFALALQERFFEHSWPEGINATYVSMLARDPEAGVSVGEGWNGLRVRVGIHHGRGDIRFEELTQGYDYYGTVVNTAARVEGVAHGGQIVVTDTVFALVKSEALEMTSLDFGHQVLRGLTDPVQLYQLVPLSLAARRFPRLRLEVEVLVDDDSVREGAAGADGTSTVGGRGTDLASSTGGAQRSLELWIDGFAKKWKPHDAKNAAAQVSAHFAYTKMLFSTCPPKYVDAVVAQLLTKWNVPNRQRESVNSKILQLVFRVAPAAEMKSAATAVQDFTTERRLSGSFKDRTAWQKSEIELRPSPCGTPTAVGLIPDP